MSDRPLSTIRPISRVGIRTDNAGKGHYQASRLGADDKRYAHEGVDLTAPTGDPVVSPFDGVVDIRDAYDAVKYPQKKEFKIVSVTTDSQRYRFFYVSPESHDGTKFVRDGDRITAGQQIGIVQNIAKTNDKKEMLNHVHFAISSEIDKNKKPNYVDPTPQVDEWMRN